MSQGSTRRRPAPRAPADGSMAVDRVTIHYGQIPVKLTFSYGAVNTFPFTVVRLRAGGAEGLGEVLLHPTPSALGFLPTLVGKDPRRLDALLPHWQDDGDRIFLEAVSIALHDLVGRASGLPFHSLLGGKTRDEVPLMPCLFPTSPEDAAERARHFFRQGYRGYMKVKLIGALDEDTARVKAIRSVTGPDLVLQGDANEGYRSVKDARLALKTLGAAGLNVMEDPLRGGAEDYAKLRGTGGAKVMVDALARRTADLLQVLRREAADVVGLHPDQPGSMSRAMQNIRLVQAFGVPLVMGGTGYASVGSAAYQHMTAVVGGDGPCGELGGYFDHGMPRLLVRETLPMSGGAVRIPDSPGLGVTLDEDAVAEFETGRQTWA